MASLPPPVAVPSTPSLTVKDISELYDLHDAEEMGVGGFSRVIVGTHKATGQRRAVKVMLRSRLVGKAAEMVAHEKEILHRTQHPNIIHLHECITTADKIYMVLDLMQGDLYDALYKRGKGFPEDVARRYMGQLMSAVKYLHDNSVIHRDIKPENILLSQDGELKLADFGLAKFMMDWNVKSTPVGTSFYIAPEIIRGIESFGARPLCTNKDQVKFVDMWSCGVVAYVLLTGRPPFYGQIKTPQERRQLLAKIDSGLLFPDRHGWNVISAEAKDFVFKCLTQETTSGSEGGRMSSEQAVMHPWIRDVCTECEAKRRALVGGHGSGTSSTAQTADASACMRQETKTAPEEPVAMAKKTTEEATNDGESMEEEAARSKSSLKEDLDALQAMGVAANDANPEGSDYTNPEAEQKAKAAAELAKKQEEEKGRGNLGMQRPGPPGRQ